MTAFDLSEAEERYREMSAEDLADIAWVDAGYLPEAKELAVAELQSRGLAGSKQDLVERSKREMQARKELREDADSAVHQQSAQWRDRLGTVVLVMLLWSFALLAPFESFWIGASPDWRAVLLSIAWLAIVVDAVRKALRGERLGLYLYLVGPLVAMLASLACRMVLARL